MNALRVGSWMLFVLAGCPSPAVVDGGTEPALDAPRVDGSVDDARVEDGGLDVGLSDAPLDLDGGSLDGGSLDGGGVDLDAGGVDGGSVDGDAAVGDAAVGDGGRSDAGRSDAGSSDASVGDSGAADASVGDSGGADSGVTDVTTCSIAVSPTTGTVADTFTFSGASNGSSCTARVDGGLVLTVPCVASMDFAGSTFGVGPHTVVLSVGAGPSGATSCMASFTVNPVTTTTSCSLSVSPESGPPSTTFTATFASDGTGCTLSVDTFTIGSVACTSTFMGMGSLVGPGIHTATLSVADGPGGATSCSDTFTVTP